MNYFLPDKPYKVLKWTGLIACPAIATFYGVCAPLWGWPAPEAVVTTVNAAGVCVGVLIGASHASATEDETNSED